MFHLKIGAAVVALAAASVAQPDYSAAPTIPQLTYDAPSIPPTYAPPTPPSTYAPLPPISKNTYGQPSHKYGPPEPGTEKPAYSFDWAVKDHYSGNDFGQQETRDGYNTQGSYYMLLPDGRVEKVTYTVNGDSGFVATVEFEGEAKVEEKPYGHQPAPAYEVTPPVYYQTQPPAPVYTHAPAYA